MSEKVIALPGVKLADGKASEPVVQVLEEVLALARVGQVAAIGIAYVRPDHVVGRIKANAGQATGHDMVAACVYLLDFIKAEMTGESL